ncbi:putative membrane protein [Candidatus Nanobsidianus stetteri]|uniref:Putative membrane protein n=1 Tax=Nanobsidianus stetteri TaxID=1294122 RepID=R1E533_NANST|nr:putative membrane protein [Candidatus Nanobsidianus stetteri]
MEEELYATKYELYISLIITLIVIAIIANTLINLPYKNLYYMSTLIILILIVIDVYVYLSYKGKIPLYKVKRKD